MAGIFEWIQHYLALHPFTSPVIYVLLHILFATCLIPCSPMTVIAGLLWGKWLGLIISVLGAFLSSCFTFGLSRVFFKNRVYQFLSKRYPQTDWFLEKTKVHGWKFVASAQLNPVVPGSVLGYLFGLTKIEFTLYAVYVILFMLPLQLLLVITGDSIPKIVDSNGSSWFVVEAVVILFLVLFVYKKMKKTKKRSRLDDHPEV